MIRLDRTSEDWPRNYRWRRWTLAQDLSEEGKLRRALLEIDGPAPKTGWLWLAFAAALAWIVMENLWLI